MVSNIGPTGQVAADSALVAPPLVQRTFRLMHFLPALSLTLVWLSSRVAMPAVGFNGIPVYVAFSMLMFFYLPKETVGYAIRMALVLILYELIKIAQPGFAYTFKSFAAIIAFSCIISVTYGCLKAMKSYSDNQLAEWLRIILWLISIPVIAETLVSFAGVAIPTPYHNYIFGFREYSGLLKEPSFLALAMTPYMFMLVYRPSEFMDRFGWSSVILLVVVTLACPAATLVAFWILAIGITAFSRILRGNFRTAVSALILAVIIFYVMLSVPAIRERVEGVLTTGLVAQVVGGNASTLAFLKGLGMSLYALRHFPLGVAFQNMHSLAPHSPISFVSDFMFHLNSNDGTSLLFKGICELGLFFEIASILGLIYFVRRVAWVTPKSFYELMLLSFQFTVFAHFIRGSSFYATMLPIGLAALIFGIASDEDVHGIIRWIFRRQGKAREVATGPTPEPG